mgnify:CR=1 FL=1
MYRILLADDEGIMLESLKKIIETEYGNECEIHCAKSGRVVVEMAQAYPPDICFMDIQMPVMNGFDTTLTIRKMKDDKKAMIPIIAMTANAFAEDRQKALSVGMNDHVAKPVDMNILAPTMMKYL